MLMYEYLEEDNLKVKSVDLQKNQVEYEVGLTGEGTVTVLLEEREVPLVLRGTKILLGKRYPLKESSIVYSRILERFAEDVEGGGGVDKIDMYVSYHVHNYVLIKRYTTMVYTGNSTRKFDAYTYFTKLDKYREGEITFTDYILHDYGEIKNGISVTSIEEELSSIKPEHVNDYLEETIDDLLEGYPPRYQLSATHLDGNHILYKETEEELIFKGAVLTKDTQTSSQYKISKESKERLPWLQSHPTSDTLEVYLSKNGLGVRVLDASGGVLWEELGVYNTLAYNYMLYGNKLT